MELNGFVMSISSLSIFKEEIKNRLILFFNRHPWLKKNTANLITISGLATAAGVIYLFESGWSLFFVFHLAFFLCFYTALSDLADGWIARLCESATLLGSDLDKLRDKIISIYIFWRQMLPDINSGYGHFAALTKGVIRGIIAIEVLLILIWVMARLFGWDTQANRAGKVKMATYYVATTTWLGFKVLQFYLPVPYALYGGVLLFLLGFGTMHGVLSLILYGVRYSNKS